MKTIFKKHTCEENIPADILAWVKKVQGYVSGTEFSSEITLKTVDVSKARVSGMVEFNLPVINAGAVKRHELDTLNNVETITRAFAIAINQVPNVNSTVKLGTDYNITNSGQEGNYKIWRAVKFTVNTNGDKISGTFTFNVNVKGITQ